MTSPDTVIVVGGRPLKGAVPVEGCKISTVAMIAASLLTDELVTLENVPDLLDTRVLVESLVLLGASVEQGLGTLHMRCAGVRGDALLPEALVGSVHGPLYLLPALLVRDGVVRAHLGPRAMAGTEVDLENWYGAANNKFISGATKTAILAGVCARGETTIRGAYWRSPIIHLCRFLRSMGATIEGEGTRCIRIQGRSPLDRKSVV